MCGTRAAECVRGRAAGREWARRRASLESLGNLEGAWAALGVALPAQGRRGAEQAWSPPSAAGGGGQRVRKAAPCGAGCRVWQAVQGAAGACLPAPPVRVGARAARPPPSHQECIVPRVPIGPTNTFVPSLPSSQRPSLLNMSETSASTSQLEPAKVWGGRGRGTGQRGGCGGGVQRPSRQRHAACRSPAGPVHLQALNPEGGEDDHVQHVRACM